MKFVKSRAKDSTEQDGGGVPVCAEAGGGSRVLSAESKCEKVVVVDQRQFHNKA